MEFSVKKYCWAELELLTESSSEGNFIGNVKFGKVYWGKTEQGQEVTVKIWFRFDSQSLGLANRHANYSLTRLKVSIYLYTLHIYISFICLLQKKTCSFLFLFLFFVLV